MVSWSERKKSPTRCLESAGGRQLLTTDSDVEKAVIISIAKPVYQRTDDNLHPSFLGYI
jgi:hypothetical protein